jgi:DNA-binding transcriptional regulator YhcF (GntR family)
MKDQKIRRARRHQRRHHSNGRPFIQLFRYMLDSPAYVSLSVWARVALVEITRGYNGSNNGKIVLSVRDLAKRMNCHRDTAARALQVLVDKSLSIMAGMPLMVVARNLGHHDTRMVEKHYGHLTDSFVNEAIRANAPRFGTAASKVVPLR